MFASYNLPKELTQFVCALVLIFHSGLVTFAATGTQSPAPISDIERDVIQGFIRDKSATETESSNEQKALRAKYEDISFNTVLVFEDMASADGIARMRTRLDRSDVGFRQELTIVGKRWSTVKEQIARSNLQPRLKELIGSQFDKAHARFLEAQSESRKAGLKHKRAIADVLAFLQANLPNLTITSGYPVFSNQELWSTFVLLMDQISAASNEHARVASGFYSDDGTTPLLKCALGGYNDSTNPDLRLCAVHVRFDNIYNRAMEDLKQLQSNTPAFDALQEVLRPERLMNGTNIEAAHRVVLKFESSLRSAENVFSEAAEKMEVLLIEAEVKTDDRPELSNTLDVVRHARPALFGVFVAQREACKAIHETLDFFGENLGSINFNNGKLELQNEDQRRELAALGERLEALEVRAQDAKTKFDLATKQLRGSQNW